MELLPKWILNDERPSFYDTESVTAITSVARLHGAMNELIKEYNAFADRYNKIVADFTNDANTDREVFEVAMRQEFQDFINVIDLKVRELATTIDDNDTKVDYTNEILYLDGVSLQDETPNDDGTTKHFRALVVNHTDPVKRCVYHPMDDVARKLINDLKKKDDNHDTTLNTHSLLIRDRGVETARNKQLIDDTKEELETLEERVKTGEGKLNTTAMTVEEHGRLIDEMQNSGGGDITPAEVSTLKTNYYVKYIRPESVDENMNMEWEMSPVLLSAKINWSNADSGSLGGTVGELVNINVIFSCDTLEGLTARITFDSAIGSNIAGAETYVYSGSTQSFINIESALLGDLYTINGDINVSAVTELKPKENRDDMLTLTDGVITTETLLKII